MITHNKKFSIEESKILDDIYPNVVKAYHEALEKEKYPIKICCVCEKLIGMYQNND